MKTHKRILAIVGLVAASAFMTTSADAQTRKLPDGTIIYGDGTRRLPNGTVIYPDGNRKGNDGVVTLPDGTVVTQDGRRVDQQTRHRRNGKRLPPGQAKKIYGGSAKDYAPGQQKKHHGEWKEHGKAKHGKGRKD
jgi:hypothetical protein